MDDKDVIVEISSSKINMERLMEFVGSPEAGAISTFSGTTRNNFNGKKVAASYLSFRVNAKII
jgi:molybdopterin synthase catalytic subunit